MNLAIRDAVNSKTVIRFTYKETTRTVEPHAHGQSKKGEEIIRAFEDGGECWKLFKVDSMSNIEVLAQVGFLKPRPGYKSDDSAMSMIYAQL